MLFNTPQALAFWRELGSPRYVLAPMVGGSEAGFRYLVLKYGCDLAYGPMLHSRLLDEDEAYARKSFPELKDLPGYRKERLVQQLCGCDPDTVLRAALKIQHRVVAIDLNAGCPQGIARRGQYGAFLLQKPELLLRIVRKLIEETSVPIFVKIRIAENDAELKDLDPQLFVDPSYAARLEQLFESRFPKTLYIVRELDKLGIAALAIHLRDISNKGHSISSANANFLRYLRKVFRKPLIANGSVASKVDADAYLASGCCDAVMVAEAALENPALFHTQRISRLALVRELGSISERLNSPLQHFRFHVWKLMFAFLKHRPEFYKQFAVAKSVQELLQCCEKLAAEVPEESITGDEWYRRHR